MHHKRERMQKVKQVSRPLPPPILGVNVFLLILPEKNRSNSIKSYHVYKGMIPLHIDRNIVFHCNCICTSVAIAT